MAADAFDHFDPAKLVRNSPEWSKLATRRSELFRRGAEGDLSPAERDELIRLNALMTAATNPLPPPDHERDNRSEARLREEVRQKSSRKFK